MVNVILTLALLLVYLDHYNLLGKLSLLVFLNLLVPFLVGINLLFLIYWIILKSNMALLSAIVLVPCYFIFGSFFRVLGSNSNVDSGDIRILTFNVHAFAGPHGRNNGVLAEDVPHFISEQNADIITIQEFTYINDDTLDRYPYRYINYSGRFSEGYVNQAIYSKYPIISKGSLDFPESQNNAIYADIVVTSDTLRIYNVHLQSLSFRLGAVKREEPQRLYKRLGKALGQQEEQATFILNHMKRTHHKKIIAGDFNNTQFSRTYRKFKGDFKDTFIERGSGLGSTYHLRLLPFRIDFILLDPSLEVTAHRNFDVQLSDHKPVMASFRLHGDE